MNTDYKPSAMFIGTTATVEFLLVQVAENCTFGIDCLYDEEGKEDCSHWVWGEETNIVDTSQANVIQNTGQYFYKTIKNTLFINCKLY